MTCWRARKSAGIYRNGNGLSGMQNKRNSIPGRKWLHTVVFPTHGAFKNCSCKRYFGGMKPIYPKNVRIHLPLWVTRGNFVSMTKSAFTRINVGPNVQFYHTKCLKSRSSLICVCAMSCRANCDCMRLITSGQSRRTCLRIRR